MSFVEALRYADLFAIFLSIGFMVALSLRLWELGVSLPWYLHFLGASYCLYALVSAFEIQIAIANHLPGTWRTIIVTAAAALGFAASGSAYAVWLRFGRGKE